VLTGVGFLQTCEDKTRRTREESRQGGKTEPQKCGYEKDKFSRSKSLVLREIAMMTGNLTNSFLDRMLFFSNLIGRK
jgi:hypothetical protein